MTSYLWLVSYFHNRFVCTDNGGWVGLGWVGLD